MDLKCYPCLHHDRADVAAVTMREGTALCESCAKEQTHSEYLAEVAGRPSALSIFDPPH